jgi:hypothetical protein
MIIHNNIIMIIQRRISIDTNLHPRPKFKPHRIKLLPSLRIFEYPRSRQSINQPIQIIGLPYPVINKPAVGTPLLASGDGARADCRATRVLQHSQGNGAGENSVAEEDRAKGFGLLFGSAGRDTKVELGVIVWCQQGRSGVDSRRK